MTNVIPFLPPTDSDNPDMTDIDLPIDADVADLDFEPVPEIRRHSQIERNKRTRGLLTRVGQRAPDAVGILGLHKHELIALVRTRGVADGRDLLALLKRAAEDAETLAGLLDSAWGRLAVAIASVENDDGEGSVMKEGNR